MRLSESILSAPLIIIGWIIAFVFLGIMFKYAKKLDNKDLTKMAAVGGYIFVISSIPIPLPIPVPIPLNLSGVMLALVIFGTRRGILVSSGSMILNHIIFAGSLGALGVNLSNMIIVSLALGYLPHKLLGLDIVGRRLDYFITFIFGFLFIIMDGIIVMIEVSLSHSIETDLSNLFIGIIVFLVIIGIVEGLFTAISFSYINRTKLIKSNFSKEYGKSEGITEDLILEEDSGEEYEKSIDEIED